MDACGCIGERMALSCAKISHAVNSAYILGFSNGNGTYRLVDGSPLRLYGRFCTLVAFILLTIIGINMLIDGIKKKRSHIGYAKCTDAEWP